MCLTEEKMWQAVVDCDETHDGTFFYAVRTVGVYCRPSCKSRELLRKNVRYFGTAAEAEQAGFRPCKRCRPDMLDYAPVEELARQTKSLMDHYYHQQEQLNVKLRGLGRRRGIWPPCSSGITVCRPWHI